MTLVVPLEITVYNQRRAVPSPSCRTMRIGKSALVPLAYKSNASWTWPKQESNQIVVRWQSSHIFWTHFDSIREATVRNRLTRQVTHTMWYAAESAAFIRFHRRPIKNDCIRAGLQLPHPSPTGFQSYRIRSVGAPVTPL